MSIPDRSAADTSPDPPDAATVDHTPSPGEGPGSRVGRYKLLQPIGEGGFGAVYMAEQEHPVRRRVALKLIKPGMDTRQVIARFEAERQALAMMDHPNIAKVLDAGETSTGRPYFVMELVKGKPITEYCDENRLDTRARLDLFTQVCRAVQHAHQKAVIHRDIKPSNVLVSLQEDGKPLPKVIDFGIAKATQTRLTEKTLFTEFRHFIGTPEYMSPEQADAAAMDVDTRSDIYSLGVLLYELLTGVTPFDGRDLRQKAYAEIQRIIREVEPPRPSTRLSTLGEHASGVAARRRTDTRRLGRLVRGELDWVVMKCLEKDRTRRYDTANALASDVHRYLSGEPVAAGPPSRVYRLRKFARQHARALSAGALVAASLVLGTGAATYGLLRARRDRDNAVNASAKEAVQRREAQRERDVALNAKNQAVRAAYRSNVLAAGAFARFGATDDARRVLLACDPALRGWEWEVQRLALDNSLTATDGELTDVPSELAWRRDGTGFLVSGNKGVAEWDARASARGRLLRGEDLLSAAGVPSPDPTASQQHRAFSELPRLPVLGLSPDGVRIAVAVGDDIAILAADTLRPEGRLGVAPSSVRRLAFSPKGNLVAVMPQGTGEKSVRVFDWRERTLKLTLPWGRAGYDFAAFCPDGRVLAAGSSYWKDNALGEGPGAHHLRFWNTNTGDLIFSIDSVCYAGTWSPNGTDFAVVQGDSLAVIDVKRKAVRFSVPLVDPATVAYSPSGALLAVALRGGSVSLIGALNGKVLYELMGPPREWYGPLITFTPDGKSVVAASLDSARLWRLDLTRRGGKLRGPRTEKLAQFSSDGRSIFVRGYNFIEKISAATRLGLSTLGLSDNHTSLFALSPGGRLLVLPVRRGGFEVRDCDSGAVVRSVETGVDAGQGEIFALAFSSDGKKLATGYGGSAVTVWDTRTWRVLARVPDRDHDQDQIVCFAADGHAVLVASRGVLSAIDAGSGRQTWMSNMPDQVSVLQLMAMQDGRAIALASDGCLHEFEANTGQLRRRQSIGPPRSDRVNAQPRAALRPGGGRIASFGADGMLRIIDADDLQLVAMYKTEVQSISEVQNICLAWSPDGRRLLYGLDYGGGAIQILDATSPARRLQELNDTFAGSPGTEQDDVRLVQALVEDADSLMQAGDADGAAESYDNAVRMTARLARGDLAEAEKVAALPPGTCAGLFESLASSERAKPEDRLAHWKSARDAHEAALKRMPEIEAPAQSLPDDAFDQRPTREQSESSLYWLETAISESLQAPGPFQPAVAAVPGVIQAEDFDRGGQGTAYNERTPDDTGSNEGAYRDTAVDIDNCQDQGGGCNVGGIQAGEWLAYTVNVAEGGTYDLTLRVSSLAGGGRLHLEVAGEDLTGALTVPKTDDWQKWQTITCPGVRLPAGRQGLRVVFDENQQEDVPRREGNVCNLNWIEFRRQ